MTSNLKWPETLRKLLDNPWIVFPALLRFLWCFSIHLVSALRWSVTPYTKPRFDPERREVLYLLPNLDYFIGPHRAIGGAITHIRGVVKGLLKAGYRVHLVTEWPVPFLEEHDRSSHARKARFGLGGFPGRIYRNLSEMARYRRVARRFSKLPRSLPKGSPCATFLISTLWYRCFSQRTLVTRKDVTKLHYIS